MKTLKISEFKAKCIEQLKQVQRTGEPLLVTWRNQPLVTVHPFEQNKPARILGALRGRIEVHGDIVKADLDDEWEMDA